MKYFNQIVAIIAVVLGLLIAHAAEKSGMYEPNYKAVKK